MKPLVLAFALLAVGCSATALQVQARAANTVALGANDALPLLVAAYRAEGLAAIAAAPDRASAESGLATTRAHWRGVWGDCDGEPVRCHDGAWPAVVATHDAWARGLEDQIAGHPLDLAATLRLATALRSSYCALRNATPSGVRLPDVPGLTCSSGGAP